MNFVRRQNQFYIFATVEVLDDKLFVFGPRTAGDEGFPFLGEALDEGQVFGGLPDLYHAVEPGIAHDRYVGNADIGEKTARRFVLDIEVCEIAKYPPEVCAVGTEEYLTGTENRRNDIEGYATAVEFVEVVGPELVFDKYGLSGSGDVEEAAHVARQVEGKVAHEVGTRIVFAHFVARWRKEGEQNGGLGLCFFDGFDEGAPLLKLTERRSVYPQVASLRAGVGGEVTEDAFLPLRQFAGFGVAQSGQRDQLFVGIYSQIINPLHNYKGLQDIFQATLFRPVPPVFPCPVVDIEPQDELLL